MLKLEGSAHVRVGNHEDIFDTLQDPQVQAAILRDAWPMAARRHATQAAALVEREAHYSKDSFGWRDAPPGDEETQQAFRQRTECFGRLMQALGTAHGMVGKLTDFSRTEAPYFINHGWHADHCRLTLLAVPVGEPPLLKTSGPAATATDHAGDIIALPADSVAIFKGNRYDKSAPGLLHRRPVLTRPHARVVVQLTL